VHLTAKTPRTPRKDRAKKTNNRLELELIRKAGKQEKIFFSLSLLSSFLGVLGVLAVRFLTDF
jgi:hypothetical protein